MNLIQRITDAPLQQHIVILDDGTSFSLEIYFRPMQYGWFINQLVYEDFVLNGLRIVNSPNMLLQFQNQIPFGLACLSTTTREPSQIGDFLSRASSIYVLDAAEVVEFSEYIKGV